MQKLLQKLLRKVRPFVPLLDPTIEEWSVSARMLWWLTFFWLVVGMIVLFSASYYHGKIDHKDGLYYFTRQLISAIVGIGIFTLLVRTPIKKLLQIAPWGLIIILFLIWLTILPGLGREALGATRWLVLGPISMQPSELVKPFLVLQAAKLFGQWEKWPIQSKSVSLGIFGIVLLGILKQPNLSNTAVCGTTIWLIACVAGISRRYLAGTAGAGILVAMLSLVFNSYQRRRVLSFVNPWSDPYGDGLQLIQSLLAIGSGGFWGNGYGFSQQKLAYLPIQDTDFIFSVYAEEFGYLGSIVLLLMIMSYATIGLIIAYHAKNMTHRLVAVGAMTFIVMQSILNIAVATGAFPTTGLPLPFFSYGGNSLLASLVMSALLIRVARESSEEEEDKEKVVPITRTRRHPHSLPKK